jgi:hypothetical protein
VQGAGAGERATLDTAEIGLEVPLQRRRLARRRAYLADRLCGAARRSDGTDVRCR